MKMDFTILKSFIAVAEEKSFSEAAKHLFISRQSLSKQIAKLEEELDTSLFVRRPPPCAYSGRQAVFADCEGHTSAEAAV